MMMAPAGAQLFAQDITPPDQQPQQQQQVFTPEQLDSLVAPIALYPDPLLSQVLVASTYPLEIVEANQWLQQNGNLQGTALVQAAQQQNWDPSIQALVPFQDVIKRMASDVRWTTDLGNAFLAQQADVMNAVQQMRQRARDNGRLTDTQQQRVIDDNQNGQRAIEIQPADPQVVYVPTYNPAYFWGDPGFYPWPALYYPAVGYGWGWGFGIHIGFFFGGWGGWGGWGWGPGWFNHTVIVNNGFFNRYNFHGYGRYGGTGVWAHNPAHRLTVPYANRAVAQRFAGSNGYQTRNDLRMRQQGAARSQNYNGNAQRFSGGNSFQPRQQQNVAPNQYRSAPQAQSSRSQNYGGQSFRGQSFAGHSSAGQSFAGQSYVAPQRFNGGNSYQPRNEMRAPQQSAAPRSYSAPSQSHSFSAPSAPRGGGGGGGGHASSGGGGHRR
jgi:hypothetical protein